MFEYDLWWTTKLIKELILLETLNETIIIQFVHTFKRLIPFNSIQSTRKWNNDNNDKQTT